jgi:hypothetical protein
MQRSAPAASGLAAGSQSHWRVRARPSPATPITY